MRTKRVLVIGAVISALLVTAAGTAQAGGTDPTANSTNPSIVDGRLVDSAPWAVQVRRNGGFTCSGSIFAANWVLTAAHCIGGASPSAIAFLIGDVRLGQGTSARAKAMHTRNDLAVIELDRNVTTTYVKLAATNPPIGARADIYGWGVTCSGGGCGLSRQLKTATNRIASVRGDKLSHETLDGYAESGDSGGPSIYNGEQVGELCCGGTRYNDYTSIPTHIAWIRQVTGIGSVNPTSDAA